MRTLPLLLTGGCIWIGPEAYQDRLDDFKGPIDLQIAEPPAIGACIPGDVRIVASVSEAWEDEALDTRAKVGQAPELDGPTVTVPETDGDRAPLVVLVPSAPLLGTLDCADVCEEPLVLTVEADDEVSTAETTLRVAADREPVLSEVVAIGTDGSATPLDTLDSVLVPEHSRVAIGLSDPHAAIGADHGQITGLLCDPSVTTPSAADPGCTELIGTLDASLPVDGDVALSVPTEDLAALSCADDPGAALSGWLLVEDHPCSDTPVAIQVWDSRVFLAADCDGDGDAYDVDCDDLDPDRGPSTAEVWYDGIDQDCDGNDDDQDSDGSPEGDDCDDTDPNAFPKNPAADTCGDAVDADCDGTDGAGVAIDRGGSITAYQTLSDALQQLADGDALRLCAGTHIGNIDVPFSLDVLAQDPGVTLQANDPQRAVIRFAGGPMSGITSRIEGLIIEGGRSGIDADGVDLLEVVDCEITGNTGATDGGGLRYMGPDLTVSGTWVHDNGAQWGGGVFLRGASATFDTTIIELNQADEGGGLYMVDATALLNGNSTEIRNNTATVRGGGVVHDGQSLPMGGPPPRLDGGVILLNDAPIGGGLAIGDDAGMPRGEVVNTVVDRNQGGGVYVEGLTGDVLLQDVRITANTAADGAGILTTVAALRLSGVELQANEADDEGGAIYVSEGTVSYEGDVVQGNLAGTNAPGVRVTGTGVFRGCDYSATVADGVTNDNALPASFSSCDIVDATQVQVSSCSCP